MREHCKAVNKGGVGWQQTHLYSIIRFLRQMRLVLVGKGQVPKKSVGASFAVEERGRETLAGQKWLGECIFGGG